MKIINILQFLLSMYACALFMSILFEFATNFKYNIIDKIYKPVMFISLTIILVYLIGAVIYA